MQSLLSALVFTLQKFSQFLILIRGEIVPDLLTCPQPPLNIANGSKRKQFLLKMNRDARSEIQQANQWGFP